MRVMPKLLPAALHIILIFPVAAFFALARAGDFVAGGPCIRGRVHLEGNSIASDWNTRLRMRCWTLDISNSCFPRDELVTAKFCGINGVHVFCELTTENSSGAGCALTVSGVST